jgi:hypothetical protein
LHGPSLFVASVLCVTGISQPSSETLFFPSAYITYSGAEGASLSIRLTTVTDCNDSFKLSSVAVAQNFNTVSFESTIGIFNVTVRDAPPVTDDASVSSPLTVAPPFTE